MELYSARVNSSLSGVIVGKDEYIHSDVLSITEVDPLYRRDIRLSK